MKIESVNGKKILTAKDPQGRLLFSGPIDSKEDLDKVPADVRQRYDKLEQKDLPGVLSTASADKEDDNEFENGDEDDGDANRDDDSGDDDDDEESEPSEPSMQQVAYRSCPRSFGPLNITLL